MIGSDSPTLPVAYVEQAFELLERFPVVLGPSHDGGYYLVGAAGRVPAIFQNVAWSTPQVWEQTVRLLRDNQIPFAELPPWYDVDEEHDLRVLEEELMHHPDEALRGLFMAVRKVWGR